MSFAGSVWAQTNSGSIRVAVSDASNLVLAGAKVQFENSATNVKVQQTTNTEGYAVFTPVPVGVYSVEITAAGFQTVRVSGITVNVDERRLVPVKMGLASTTQVVEVTAAAAVLQSEDGSLGQVVDGQAAVELPLAGRRYTELALMTPGVAASTLTEDTRGPGWFVANGNYHTQNNFLIDGADNNHGTTNAQSMSAQVVQPSPDSIGEFKVQTNSFSAEFGRSAGAVVNVSIKSGTNQVHGSGWYYNRDQQFAATSWGAKLIGAPKDDLSWNQFGATLGGPLKKNKLFYFVDYEGFRRNFSSTFLLNVPTLAQKSGVFGVNITDPITKVLFPNRTVPPSAMDPLGAKIMALYPDPNLTGRPSGARTIENYGASRGAQEDTHKGNFRGDYYLNSKHSFSFRYSHLRQEIVREAIFPGLADGEGNQGAQQNFNHSSGMTWTANVSPRVVNTFRFAYNRTFAEFAHASTNEMSATEFGFKGIPKEMQEVGGLPLLSISNYRQLGTRNFRPQNQNPKLLQFADSISLVRGKHSLRAGFDLRAKGNVFLDITRRTPAYSFTGTFTGESLVDLLTGAPVSVIVNTVPFIDQRQQAWSGFVQDDWKIARRVTLNLGMRYEYATPYYGAGKNVNINFDPVTGKLFQAGDRNQYAVATDRNNFGPRLGAAWQVKPGKVVLRGGFGMFYSGEDLNGSEANLPLNPTQLIQSTLQRTGNGPPPLRLSEPIPAGILSSYDSSTVQLRTRELDFGAATIYQWNVALQLMLPAAFTLETAYVGNQGRNLFTLWERNQTSFGLDGSIAANRPYPQWRSIQTGASRAGSYYNALQVKLERRFTKGFFFLGSYTFASAMDNAGAWDAGNTAQTLDNFAAEKGPQAQNSRHRLSISGIQRIPFGKGHRWGNSLPLPLELALGGWQVSNIITYRTGLPVNISLPSTGVDPNTGVRFTFLGRNGGSLRPDRVGTPLTGISPKDDRFQFLDETAFRVQAANTPGNSSRNVAIGPSFVNYDLSLQKRIPLGERSLELRLEGFNVFNQTRYRNPNGSFTSTTFGVIGSAYEPRIVQMALRFRF